jgi:hypothetical protein
MLLTFGGCFTKKLQRIIPEREKVIILHQDLSQPGWGEGYVKCYAIKFCEFWNLVPNKKISKPAHPRVRRSF